MDTFAAFPRGDEIWECKYVIRVPKHARGEFWIANRDIQRDFYGVTHWNRRDFSPAVFPNKKMSKS